MQIIKSEKYEMNNNYLESLSHKIQKLEEKMICDNCSIRRKDYGLCSLETECEYYND